MENKHITPPIVFVLEDRINELEKEIKDFQTGLLGGCPTCEPVAIFNQQLNKDNKMLINIIMFLSICNLLVWLFIYGASK